LEQVKGVEPSCSAWEADVLPMNYTCIWKCGNIIALISRKCKSGFCRTQKNPPPHRTRRVKKQKIMRG
jgi:hypothetical protein